MKSIRRVLPIVITASLLAMNAQAAVSITSLFGTGLDSSGSPLAVGASDPHYTVVDTGTAGQVLRFLDPYFANDTSSQWIWENANGQPTSVTRTFRTTFDLTGLDPSTATITGLWGADNTGMDILLNSSSTGNSIPGAEDSNFKALHPFSINAGFVSGINTLDFVIKDEGILAAFRVQLSGTADVPGVPSVPESGSSILMFSMVLVAIGFFGKMTRR